MSCLLDWCTPYWTWPAFLPGVLLTEHDLPSCLGHVRMSVFWYQQPFDGFGSQAIQFYFSLCNWNTCDLRWNRCFLSFPILQITEEWHFPITKECFPKESIILFSDCWSCSLVTILGYQRCHLLAMNCRLFRKELCYHFCIVSNPLYCRIIWGCRPFCVWNTSREWWKSNSLSAFVLD